MRLLVSWVLALVSAGPSILLAQDTLAPTPRAIIAIARHPWSRWPDFSRHVDAVTRLYGSANETPIWLGGSSLTRAGRLAIGELLAAGNRGLDSADYDADKLDSLGRGMITALMGSADRSRFDLLLSIDLLRYLDDLSSGRLRPNPLVPSGGIANRFDLAAIVARAARGDSLVALIAQAEPQLAQYRNLRRVLGRYRALANDPSLTLLPPTAPVRPGERYGGVAQLARRLVSLDDFDPAGVDTFTTLYQGELVAAVRRFQSRHALEPDGVLGPETMAALNTPPIQRVRQIEFALERLRWLPSLKGERFIVVNIPAFQLFAFDSVGGNGAPSLTMKVVIGRTLDTQTPVLFEQMRYVEFRPYWNVPRSILLKEMLPQLERNRGFLRRNDMELIAEGDSAIGSAVTPDVIDRLIQGDLRVRQRPGPQNPLGAAKFIFPNASNVYLHGTSEAGLFSRARRDLSHGCIRLEDPAALAGWVLRDQPQWGRDSILAAMQGPTSTRVLLSKPLPVVIFYTTAVAFPDGGVHFYADIYGHDRALAEALEASASPP